MSQANPVIGPNKSGLTYRQEDNDGKKAILSHHKGAAAPSYAEAGMIWLDDSATPWLLKLYDGADWVSLAQVNAATNTVVPYMGADVLQAPLLATDSGSADAYAVAPVPAISAYAAGQMFLLNPAHMNTGSSTLAVNGLSAVAITMPDGTATPPGALRTSGTYLLMYNGVDFALLNPTASVMGGCLQSVSDSYSGSGILSATIPYDDTIPTSSEGTEILSVSITPQSSTSRMVIRCEGLVGVNSAAGITLSLFVNGTSSALMAIGELCPTGGIAMPMHIAAEHVPGSLSPVTYKMRLGASSSGIRPNGTYGGRLFGGCSKWLMTVEEYA